MKRSILPFIAFFGFCTGMLIVGPNAQGSRIFGVHSLNCTYHFVTTAAGEEPLGVNQHCNGFGAAKYFGDGNVVVLKIKLSVDTG